MHVTLYIDPGHVPGQVWGVPGPARVFLFGPTTRIGYYVLENILTVSEHVDFSLTYRIAAVAMKNWVNGGLVGVRPALWRPPSDGNFDDRFNIGPTGNFGTIGHDAGLQIYTKNNTKVF